MSDSSEPISQQLLAAVQAIGTRIGQLQESQDKAKFELGTRIAQLQEAQDKAKFELGTRIAQLQEAQDKAKFELMDRIDRVQDTVNEQRDDMTVLLGLISSNQKIAERGFSEARLALDQHSSMAQTVVVLERQVRKLQAQMRELRGQ